MIFKAIEYVLSSKPAGEGSELTELDKARLRIDSFKPFKKSKKQYNKNSKTRKVMGDIT
jgi:hypothetical protein